MSVIAVVGATGVVGKEIIQILDELSVDVTTLKPLASARSAGQTVQFNGQYIEVEELTHNSFDGVDYALFSAGGSISKEFAPSAVKSGAIVVDNTSHFRMDETVPLVVPEVNTDALASHNGIIANPNCSTAQLVVALKPIDEAYGIKRLVIATYQSVSGAGKEALDELESQTRQSLNGAPVEPKVFAHPIAFNIIPQIDVFCENGYTKEEMKMINEIKKIMGRDDIAISATCARVPVFIGHSEAVNIETKKPIDIAHVNEILDAAQGVQVVDDPANLSYPTPRDISGQNDVQIGRIRRDISVENGLELWCVGDNLRKGAALNAVQIVQALTSSL